MDLSHLIYAEATAAVVCAICWRHPSCFLLLSAMDGPAKVMSMPSRHFVQPHPNSNSAGHPQVLPTHPKLEGHSLICRGVSMRKRYHSETRLEWDSTGAKPTPTTEYRLQFKALNSSDSFHTPVASHSAHSPPCFQNTHLNTMSSGKHAIFLLKQKP